MASIYGCLICAIVSYRMYFGSGWSTLLTSNEKIDTFASQCLVFEGKIESFFLENASNFTLEFLYDKFNKKV